VLRPVNRLAFTNPATQTQYNRVVDLFIYLNACSGPLPEDMVNRVKLQVSDIINRLGPEAVPALVRGLNQIGIFNIGFC
jgi:hypothetical protein